MKTIDDFAPMKRSRECDRDQNRAFRRNVKNMTEGMRRKEMRLMYVEIGKFALKVKDSAIVLSLLNEYEEYTRVQNPRSDGIKAKHAKMCKWYDAVREDYIQAHKEDSVIS